MSFKIDFKNTDAIQATDFSGSENLSWLADKKQLALETYKLSKIPTRKVEHWKYNDMSFLSGQTFDLATKPSNEEVKRSINIGSQIELDTAIELIFVDGFLTTPLADTTAIKGLNFTLLEDLNEQQKTKILDQIDPEFNQKNLLVNFNEAINQNSLLIEVDKNTNVSTPIYLRHFVSNRNNLSSQKTIICLAESSQLTLIEQFDSSVEDLEQQLSLQQTAINLANNSHFNHYRLNLEKDTTRQVSQVKTLVNKDAVLNSFYLGLGSLLNRTDIDVLHVGHNAECFITGIYLPAKSQNIDYHTNIQHRVSHCNSNEVFRGIIADKASATFNGKIHIFQDAQKSDAYLNNKNLLLTNQAEVNTKPELEIYADDVVCAHGATVAQIDQKALYYMQTRGLNKKQAKRVLSIAFIQELLNKIKLQPIQQHLNRVLEKHMSHLE